jgi:hypothetical protein
MFVEGIGPDTISDLTTNIIRGLLAEYTFEQCELNGLLTTRVNTLGPTWNPVTRDWEASTLSLPVSPSGPILLVPRFSVRRHICLDAQEFWNHHMVDYLQAEYLQAGGALVQVLKNGRRRVTKKDVKAHHPFNKDDLADFVREHPYVLEAYKQLKGAEGPPEIEDLYAEFDEQSFARALIGQFDVIAEGSGEASNYHNFALGVCTFLFYPHLICPVKEYELHEGRKRIDIKFTNAAEDGFFLRMMTAPQTRALSVPCPASAPMRQNWRIEEGRISGSS